MHQGEHNRWSQLVRRPGAVEIQGHHAVEVPPLGQSYPHPEQRAGVRLLVRPLSPHLSCRTIDITSTAAMAMLEGFLHSGVAVGRRLSWRTRGFGVRRKDTLGLAPTGWRPG